MSSPRKKRPPAKAARIAVLGQGYVGLPVAMAFARRGIITVGLDIHVERVAHLARGESDIRDIPSKDLRAQVRAKRYTATTDPAVLATCDVAIICVPTPITSMHEPDLSNVLAAVDMIAAHLHPGMLVVLESTTFPGTTAEYLLPRLAARGGQVGKDFFLGFSPERIDPGNKRFPLEKIPKIVSGMTPACCQRVAALYQHIVERVVPVSSTQTAEMVKVVENTVRSVNIALVNELAQMCNRMNLNVWEVLDGAYTKPFGLIPYYPGPGVGGHCIAVDPYYLEKKAREFNFQAHFINLATDVNRHMPEYVVTRAGAALNLDGKALSRARVLLLGMAYKANISDYRESPALDVLRGLQQAGARVNYHDPFVPEIREGKKSLTSVPLNPSALQAQDLVIITTAHGSIDYSWVVRYSKRVLDTRNATKAVTVHRERIVLL